MMPEHVARSRFRTWIVDLDGTLYSPIPLKMAMAAELAMFGRQHISLIRHFRRAHELIRSSASAGECDDDLAVGRALLPVHDSFIRRTLLPVGDCEVTDGRARVPVLQPATPFDRQLSTAADAAHVELSSAKQVIDEWMIQRPRKWVRLFRRRWLLREIARFRLAGGRTAIVSDYPAEAKLQALGAADLFDAVVANGESNGPSHLKPDPDGIHIAMSQLDAQPHETLMIGDRDDCDGEAAKRAGISFGNIRSGRFNGMNSRIGREAGAGAV